ncbi:aminotransferase [Labrys wisconsinensis]|uniref:aspartate transaminase n=1 Tax=Labrys wisconsinensis TaxID=425677 RepID=A0ABU0JBE9_9HYPH|nr:aminotransferase [Labrys wisconsinensis]MDQ0471610.1 aspartate/methionine/tyrosine aminotransferase [Labrys wisconsinensis]
MPAINPLLVDTATPPIPEAQGWARAYDGKAGPLIDLSQAVPGYPPHAEMLARLAQAAGRAGTASYGPIEGDTALRQAYAAHLAGRYGGDVAPEEVAITTGCNQAFFVAAVAMARAGEAVLLPSPWYFNHKMTLDMLGIEARTLPCHAEAGFVPDAAEAERLIDARTRAIVLVTPNNPTGAVYPPATVAAFAALCRRRGLFLILDETYRDFIAGQPHALFGDASWREGVLALYSFSKAYCIPGHRLGALVAARPLMAEIAKILDTLQICAPRVAQEPVAWALEGLAAWREANRIEIERRAGAFSAAFAGLNGWRVDSVGSYFAFLRHPFAGRHSAEVVKTLVEAAGVLCLPGPYFGPGQETHMRVAFANAGAEALSQLRERFAAVAS